MFGSGSSIKWLNGLVFGALAIGLVLVWLSLPARQAKLASVDLRPLVGNAKPLGLDDLRGKVVLMSFWGTWCSPCRAEFPHLVELNRNWHDSPRFQTVLVSCPVGKEDMDELRQQTLAFLKVSPANVPIYADPEYRTRWAVGEAVGFGGYPTTLVLDGEGMIRGKWVGYGPGREVEINNLIRELLSEPAKTPVDSSKVAEREPARSDARRTSGI